MKRLRGGRTLLHVFLIASVVAGEGGSAPDAATPDDSPPAIVERALEPFRAGPGPGCVCGLRRGEAAPVIGAAGMASVEHRIPLARDTPLHVGSIAKQFVAAMALMLEEGSRLDLDAPVRQLVGELPARFRTVTGRHLLTHTSGLRDYLQAAHHAGAGLHEPMSRDDTLAFLARQSRLDFPPGTDASYSNSNYFLLTSMIERAEHATIDEVAQRLIFLPLGMKSSRFLVDGLEVVPGRARGYRRSRTGELRLHEPAAGVGGMLTTLDDLLRWADHLRRMRRAGHPLVAALTTPARLEDGRVTREAAGLRVDVRLGRRVIEHNGSNRGFNAYFGWYPDDDLVVVVMCNLRQARATSLAHEITAELLGREPVARVGPPTLEASALERLAAYAGVYEAVDGDGALEIEVDPPHAAATLYGDHPSDSRTATNLLRPTGEAGVFTLSGIAPTARLALVAAEPAPTVLFDQSGGVSRRFVRASPPDGDDLRRLAGRFRSDDLHTVYELSLDEEALVLAIERPDGRRISRGRLVPVTRDLYILARDPVTNIRLGRDDRDRIIGFELSEPRLRGVAFARLSDEQSR